MAEKNISAEPVASAGSPGNGRVEADVTLNPMNRLVIGIKMNKAVKIPHSRPVHSGWYTRQVVNAYTKAPSISTQTTQPAKVGGAGKAMPAIDIKRNSSFWIIAPK